MSEESTSPLKQIRPRLRKSNKASDPAIKKTVDVHGSATTERQIEETRIKMGSWMGLQGAATPASADADNAIAQLETSVAPSPVQSAVQEEDAAAQKVKSILRKSKYTQSPLDPHVGSSPSLPDPSALPPTDNSSDQVSSAATAVCRDVIVERDPTKPMLKRRTKASTNRERAGHAAIEGYAPQAAQSLPNPTGPGQERAAVTVAASEGSVTFASDSKETDTKDATAAAAGNSTNAAEEEPLILNSLEELFDAAAASSGSAEGLSPQTHNPNKITADTKLLEADIAFSVMTTGQYEGKLSEIRKEHEEERQAQLKIFLGEGDIFGEDDDDESNPLEEDEDEDDDDLMEMLMEGDMDDEDEEEVIREPRAFRLLWDTLSEWMTHDAVQYIVYLNDSCKSYGDDSAVPSWQSPAIERSDIEASRCAGLMAMIKLYLPKCMEEVGIATDRRRQADTRLGELLRTFKYVTEAPKLPVKLWKATTCILLDLVFVERRLLTTNGEETNQEASPKLLLPASVQAIDMTTDEYRYLTHSAFQTYI